MKNIFVVFAACSLLINGVCQVPNFLASKNESYEIIMHNRPLVKIHGKTFSVMDVKKKMDLLLHEHHPETFSSTILLYQFYAQNWRPTLQEMIDNELIKMEAEAYKITISDGDIREEMDKRFGPNVVKKLDELSLSYDEAKELIRDEMVVRNMSWYRIWAKVLQRVTPEVIKSEYDNYLAKLPLTDQWVYKMVSLRGDDETGMIAKRAYDLLLQAGRSSLDLEVSKMNDELPQNVLLNVSEPITVASKDLAPEVLHILKGLPAGTFSEPAPQKSRSDGSTVYRMFYVLDHKQDETPSFEELSSKIHDVLVQKYGDTQKEEYFTKLRKKFLHEDLVVKTLFPSTYQPFTICGS